MSASPESHPTDPLQALVREHQAEVWRYLRFLGCDPGEADDLTQETFLAVVRRSIHRFGRGGARAYLRTVARNFFLEARARDRRRPRTVDLATAEAAFDWLGSAATPEEDGGQRMLTALRRCLDALPERDRAALTWRYRHGLERHEIAARLGMTGHGVKSLLQRTYARLRACVGRRLRDDD